MCFNAISIILFCGPNEKPHGVRGLSEHYHLQIYSKLGYGKCTIIRITCALIACTNMLDKPWFIVSDPTSQPHYQPVENFTQWDVLVSFNNWNIIHVHSNQTNQKP